MKFAMNLRLALACAGVLVAPAADASYAGASCNYDAGFQAFGAGALWNNTGSTKNVYCGFHNNTDNVRTFNEVDVVGVQGMSCTVRRLTGNGYGEVYYPYVILHHTSWDNYVFTGHAVGSLDAWALQCAVPSTGSKLFNAYSIYWQ